MGWKNRVSISHRRTVVIALLAPALLGRAQSPPMISPIPSPQRVGVAQAESVRFKVISTNEPQPLLTVSAESSVEQIVPNTNMRVQPATARDVMDRRLDLFPADTQSGETVITLTVTDGAETASASFTLTVLVDDTFPIFFNWTPIMIRDNSFGAPYPSTIDVPGIAGKLSKVAVSVYGLKHSFSSDVGLLLAGPQGQNVVLMNRAGAGWSVDGSYFRFSSQATEPVPNSAQITSGEWRPADYETGSYSFFAPAAANTVSNSYTTNLDSFCGSDPNGPWSLYVQDTVPGWVGEITGGWSLWLETEPVIVGLRDTNLIEGEPRSQTFTIHNALPPFTFSSFATAPTILPFEDIQVYPSDNTGTNYSVSIVPRGSGSNLNVSVFATDTRNRTFSGSFNVGTIFKRPSLSIRGEDDQFRLTVLGTPDTTYIVQVSTDLRDWSDSGLVSIDWAGTGQTSSYHTNTSDARFFRLLLVK